MKKLKISILALFIFTSLSASDELSFSVKGGLNLSNASLTFGSIKINSTIKTGINIGVFGEYMLDEFMGVQSGLVFSTKGTKYSIIDNYKTTINFNTLQLPVHFVYKFEIADGMKIGLHAGPYLACALSGKMTIVSTEEDKTNTEEINIYSKKSGMSFGRFDLGVGLGIGFEYENYLFDLGYDLGLIDQIKDIKESKGTLKTNNIYLSVGYRF